MELIMIITVLSVFFSALLPHCASLQLPLMKPPLQKQVNAHHLSLPPLPRKLMKTEQQVTEYEARDGVSHKKEKEHPSGEKKMLVGKKGTRLEWVEGDDPSQYFTMDYTRVRRRRPIHNKHIPVAP